MNYLIRPDTGIRKKKVLKMDGKKVVVDERKITLTATELLRNLLEMRGDVANIAGDSDFISEEDYRELYLFFKPDKEILVTCDRKKKGKDILLLCNFDSDEDVMKVSTNEFEVVERINKFIK